MNVFRLILNKRSKSKKKHILKHEIENEIRRHCEEDDEEWNEYDEEWNQYEETIDMSKCLKSQLPISSSKSG